MTICVDVKPNGKLYKSDTTCPYYISETSGYMLVRDLPLDDIKQLSSELTHLLIIAFGASLLINLLLNKR